VNSGNIKDAIKTSGSQAVGSKILPNLLRRFEWENDYIKPNMQTQVLYTQKQTNTHIRLKKGPKFDKTFFCLD